MGTDNLEGILDYYRVKLRRIHMAIAELNAMDPRAPGNWDRSCLLGELHKREVKCRTMVQHLEVVLHEPATSKKKSLGTSAASG